MDRFSTQVRLAGLRSRRQVSVILTADMEGFSTWMQRDEQAVIELLTETYYRFAEEMVREFEGELFQKEGDAIWCQFEDADKSLQAGLWLLQQFVSYNRGRPAQEEVRLRVGLSWGGRSHHVLQEAKKLESSATARAVHFSQDVHDRLSQPVGHLTGRFQNPTYEVFCCVLGQEPEGGERTVLVAKLSYLGPSQKINFLRACFKKCKKLEGEFYLAGQGLTVLSFAEAGHLDGLPLDLPYLQTQAFRGVTHEGACYLASSRWADPSPQPVNLDATEMAEPESLKEFRIVLEPAPQVPYKFLSSYRLADSLIFFGRDEEVANLQKRLKGHKTLLVYGKSGVGKTSLLRAGLQAYSDHSDAVFLMTRLLSSPRKVLEQEFRKNFPDLKGSRCEELWEEILLKTEQPVFLIIDEFEELFLRSAPEEQEDFLNLLRALFESSEDRAKLILSLREDYLAELFALERFWDGLAQNRMRLKTLEAESAVRSIVGPAELFGLEVESALCRRLVDSLFQEGIHPAELQIVLDRLYRAGAQDGRLTLSDFERLGGVGPILAAYLDESLKALPAVDQQRARTLLKQLVTASGTREAVSHRNLVLRLSIPESAIDSLLRYLIDARLVRVVVQSEDLGYELSHNTLVKRVQEWETPLEVARRHAEMTLRNEFRTYRRVGSLLPRDRLALLMKPDLNLEPGDDERLMLVRASVVHQMDPAFWMQEPAHQELCYPTMLEMLQDDQLASGLRRDLIVALARLPLEDRALEALQRSAVKLANPTVVKALKGVSVKVRRSLERAVEERFFGLERMTRVAAGPALVGSDTLSKQERLKVTRPDLHSRILSERELIRVELPDFSIDRWVVSNAEYAEFQPLHRHFYPPHEADFPAVNVSYEEAVEYADWLGKRLPTEEEWEKAARGEDGRKFPWGDIFEVDLVNSGESERRAPLPVTALEGGASPYGCLQMSGNVWEWTSTPWEPDSPLMAKKGGCALNFAPLMHASARYEDPPETRLRWAGFRLVYEH